MPNGHGGVPRYGSPIFLALVVFALAVIETRGHPPWAAAAAYAAAGLFGWRLAWHQFMYPVMAYGGAYASPEELGGAKRRYRVAAAIGVVASVAGVYVVWRALG